MRKDIERWWQDHEIQGLALASLVITLAFSIGFAFQAFQTSIAEAKMGRPVVAVRRVQTTLIKNPVLVREGYCKLELPPLHPIY